MGIELLFVAVNGGTLPLPDADKPIAVLEFVHVKLTPDGVPDNRLPGIAVPSVTVVSDSKSTVPRGVILTGKTTFEFTHWPEFGVKVYVDESWLFTAAGLHVPFIPLEEVDGNNGAELPAQRVNDVPKLKDGVTF